MSEVFTFDPKKVTVAVEGRIMTGYATDGVVTISHNEDRTTPAVGVQGDVTYSDSANNSGTASVTLMSTSAAIPYLREVCATRREVRLDISDANTDGAFRVSAERCRILKMPETARGAEMETATIEFYIPDLVYR
jgi:hypothetical protein